MTLRKTSPIKILSPKTAKESGTKGIQPKPIQEACTGACKPKTNVISLPEGKEREELLRLIEERAFTGASRALALANLESRIDQPQSTPLTEGESPMAKRLKERVAVGTDENGKTRYEWIDGYGKQDLLLKAAKVLLANGALGEGKSAISTSKHLFSECAEKYMELYKAGGVGPTTYSSYMQQMKKHVLPAFSARYIEDISWADIQQFYNDKTALNKESKRKLRTVLNIVFIGAMKDSFIQRNPTKLVTITGRPSTPRAILTVEQMADIISNIGSVKNESDRRYLALAVAHAMIPEEILGLRWEDINLDAKQISIRRAVVHPERNKPVIKSPKEDARIRTIGIVPGMEQHIVSSTPSEGFVFGGSEPLSFQAFKRMWERIGKQINLYGATTYNFRHTVLTDAYDATGDVKAVQAQAGHATPTMTMGRYVHGRTRTDQVAKSIASLYGCGKTFGKSESAQSLEIQGFSGPENGHDVAVHVAKPTDLGQEAG